VARGLAAFGNCRLPLPARLNSALGIYRSDRSPIDPREDARIRSREYPIRDLGIEREKNLHASLSRSRGGIPFARAIPANIWRSVNVGGRLQQQGGRDSGGSRGKANKQELNLEGFIAAERPRLSVRIRCSE